MSEFDAAFESACRAVREMVPVVVRRHRAAGLLTWRLIHQIEDEVISEVLATGRHSSQILRMLRSPAILEYPRDDREVSFEGHDVAPIIFNEVKAAWGRVD